METRNAQTILNEVMAAALVAPEFCPFEALHDTAEYKAADRANDAKRMIDLESAITTPTHITFKTGARSSHKVRNIRARLEKFAGIVRTGAKLFGGGLDKPARKPTPAVIWPAGKVKLLSEMFEDKQYTDALAMGEDELGAVFYSYDAGIYDNGSRVFMAWAPMEVDGMPEGFASVKTSDGYFRVIHALSGRSVGNGTKARNSAIFSAIESWNTMSEEKQAQALVNANARLNNCELSRAAWVEFHQIDDARAIQARITEREQMDAEREALRASRRHGYDEALVAGKLRQAQAAQDVAQVVAGAQAMAAIEQASESSALQELASDTSTEQAASQADDVQELAIVGEQVQQASQHAPGAPGGSVGHTSTTSTSSAHQVASSTHAQAINSRSGAWSALFFVSDSGAPSMKFKQTGRVPCIVEFESGRDRMRALQQSAKWADEAAARQADDAAAHDGARVCATPPASQAPEQSTPVLNSETPQDQNTDEIRSRWQNFACDIPVSMAINAYRGTSMSPERRGASAQNEYGQSMAADFETLQAQAVKGGTLALLPDVFARYRARQASSYKAYLSSSARCVSSFIAGPANFPAARMNKRSDIAHRRLNEYLDGGKMALRAAIRTLRPDLRAIMAGDVDAIDRLTVKIDNAERLQSRMRDANKAIRTHAKKGAAQQVEALMTLGFTEQQASDLLKPDFCGRIGFAAYELTNNNANIRRMHERLEQISKAQATEVQAVACSNGVTLEDDAPANRVRLYFPGKPSEEIRTELKSSGFRWAPSGGAWQAYRNNSTLATAKRMAGEPVSAPTEDSATVCAAEPESQAPEQAGPVLESESPQDQAQAEKEAGRVSDFQKSYIDDAGKQGLDGANKLLLVIRSTPSQAVAKYAQSVFDAMPIEPDSKARTDAQAVESKTPQDQGPLHPRNFIPGNGVHIVEEAFEAWTYQREARFGFVMYLGKQSKPYAYYSYATEAKRDDGFTRHATQARDILANKAKRKAETKAKLDQGHSLQVGDVVRSSWGYDQTNIDHYQIVRVIGKRTVEVRKIAEHHEATGDMTGRSAPIPGEFVGEVMRRQVDQWGNVNILSASYGRASKIEPLAVVHGVRCYAAAAYSSYA